jgi:hypothetical protein
VRGGGSMLMTGGVGAGTEVVSEELLVFLLSSCIVNGAKWDNLCIAGKNEVRTATLWKQEY